MIEVYTAASAQAMDAAGVAGGPRLSVDPNEAYQKAGIRCLKCWTGWLW